MKVKYIFLFLALAVLATPTITMAALTQAQIESIIGVIQSFGADSTTIANVRTSLNGGTPTITENPTPASPTAWCHNFATNLDVNSIDTEEIYWLHKALDSQGYQYGTSGSQGDSGDLGNSFGAPTAAAVVKFQKKYGILPQSGKVGPLTRAKLNALYGCNAVAVSDESNEPIELVEPVNPIVSCTSNWQCRPWEICTAGTQKRECQDLNACDTQNLKRNETQSCTCFPIWRCSQYITDSVTGNQSRTCTDIASCNTNADKPETAILFNGLPVVDLKVNGQSGTAVIDWKGGAVANLSWTATGATSCNLTIQYNGETKTMPVSVLGNYSHPFIYFAGSASQRANFSLACNNANGSTRDTGAAYVSMSSTATSSTSGTSSDSSAPAAPTAEEWIKRCNMNYYDCYDIVSKCQKDPKLSYCRSGSSKTYQSCVNEHVICENTGKLYGYIK